MKQFCRKGHDTFVEGRTGTSCRKCHQVGERMENLSSKRLAHKLSYNKKENKNSNWSRYKIVNEDGTQFTTIDYDRAYQIQGGRCKICAKHSTEFKKALCADHNHSTGKFRGLLCTPCNIRIGFKEKQEFKEEDKKYLGE